jgi:NAD(P)-dependent dehydrogenase (short-subunit alcohol dehydrogenase family)
MAIAFIWNRGPQNRTEVGFSGMEKTKQVALVTGASSGIGKATAQSFAANGFRVFGTSRTQHPDTDGVEMVRLDVTSDGSVTRCIEDVLIRAGHIDVLVNNAGVWQASLAEETPLSIAHALFEAHDRFL